MTIVYTVGRGSSWGDNELRISIRSMVKNTPVKRIVIVGHKPEWLTGVEHIPMKDGPFKQRNIHLKTLAACDTVEDFINVHDDHFVLRPTDFRTYYHGGLIKERRFNGSYGRAVMNTKNQIPDGLYYDLHIPMKMNGPAYKQIMSRYDWSKEYVVRSLYGNNAGIEGVRLPDCKVRDFMRRSAIEKYIQDRTFLSVGDAGLSVDMKRLLFEMFPEPSKYEIVNYAGKSDLRVAVEC